MNFKDNYEHILADTLSSMMAIAALVLGKYADWVLPDALIGLLGRIVILRRAMRLIRSSWGLLLSDA